MDGVKFYSVKFKKWYKWFYNVENFKYKDNVLICYRL